MPAELGRDCSLYFGLVIPVSLLLEWSNFTALVESFIWAFSFSFAPSVLNGMLEILYLTSVGTEMGLYAAVILFVLEILLSLFFSLIATNSSSVYSFWINAITLVA